MDKYVPRRISFKDRLSGYLLGMVPNVLIALAVSKLYQTQESNLQQSLGVILPLLAVGIYAAGHLADRMSTRIFLRERLGFEANFTVGENGERMNSKTRILLESVAIPLATFFVAPVLGFAIGAGSAFTGLSNTVQMTLERYKRNKAHASHL